MLVEKPFADSKSTLVIFTTNADASTVLAAFATTVANCNRYRIVVTV
jgi:hypothetical protein